MGMAAILVNGWHHFSNLPFPCPREAPNEIWATLAQRLQRRSHLKFWTFVPYKCIGKQTWPRLKKAKCQYTTTILATLVDLPSPKIYAKIQPQGILGFGEEDFWRFLPYMGMAAMYMDRNHFSNVSFPCPRETPNQIWATLGLRLGRSHLKFSKFFPYKCIGKQMTLP